MKPPSVLILSILFLYGNVIFSQTPSFYHYTSSEGLASSTIYDAFQDSKGFIWFATGNGVSKFDGHNFKNFGVTEGINSNLTTGLVEEQGNGIFVSSYEKGLNICRNDSVMNYPFTGPCPIKLNLILSSSGKLYGYFAGDIYYFKDNKFTIEGSFPGKRNIDGSVLACNNVNSLSNGTMIASSTQGLYSYDNGTFAKMQIAGIDKREFYYVNLGRNNELLACSDDNIYEIENLKINRIYNTGAFTGKVNRVCKDAGGNLWFSIINKGIYVIYKGSDNITNIGKKLGIEKSIITKIFEDTEGNIWVATQGKGAFCINNLYVKNYNEDDGLSNNNVHRLDMDINGNLLLGTVNGFNVFDGRTFTQITSDRDVSITPYIHSVKSYGNKVYIGYAFRKDKFERKTFGNTDYLFYMGTSFCMSKDSNYYIGSWSNKVYQSRILEDSIKQGSFFFCIGETNFINRINNIYEDSEKNIWMCTTMGVCLRKNGVSRCFPEDAVLSSVTNSIKEDNKKTVWFASEKGVKGYNLITNNITSLNLNSEPDLNSSTSVNFDNKNRMWIGNMQGLYIIADNTYKHLTTGEGLPSNEVLSLYYDKNKNVMWVGTSSGISSFDITDYDNHKLPALNVETESITAGGVVYKNFDELKFEPENNNVLINFRVINYSSPPNLSYQFKVSDDWVNASNSSLDFRSMQPGNYTVSFRAKIPNGEWSKPGIISFSIKPKFTETLWFPLGIFICFAGIVLLAAKYRINKNKKQNVEKTEIAKRISELKLHALSATMNPHFIFNSLNSVQYLVNKGKKLEANEYISIMAKLIRKNLDTANDSFILLSEEIERLNLYLEVEQLRFSEKFTYEIITGKNLPASEILIPNMIVQPFVENAVWHGIMNIEMKGVVKISFDIEDVNINSKTYECLIIKISDNGIGIAKSEKFKKEGHISHGIKIIQERLRLLSKELELPEPVVFEDLSLRNENSTGTEVIISLPNTLYKFTS